MQIVLENDCALLRRIVPWAELAGSLRHLAKLVPDDEGELKGLIEAAWTSEAVERLGCAERPEGAERSVDEQPPGGEEQQ